MSTFTRKSVLALLASLTLITVSAASAAPPQKLLMNPYPGQGQGGWELPKFGFSSFNNGWGERITGVRWGGIAQRMGLENGDTILSLNGYPLSYHGAWKDALREAVYQNGGHLKLKVRDVRTGQIAFRHTYIGDICGPIEHNHYNGGGYGGAGYGGPVTQKSQKFPGNSNPHMSGPEQIKQIVEMFD
jgi:hypothetical protein